MCNRKKKKKLFGVTDASPVHRQPNTSLCRYFHRPTLITTTPGIGSKRSYSEQCEISFNYVGCTRHGYCATTKSEKKKKNRTRCRKNRLDDVGTCQVGKSTCDGLIRTDSEEKTVVIILFFFFLTIRV